MVNLNRILSLSSLPDLVILTKKQPSADVNPANQWGLDIFVGETSVPSVTKDLLTGTIPGKA